MPLRSPKMNLFIFGFQRRVWWPKWTPASRSCFIVTTAIWSPIGWLTTGRRAPTGGDRGCARANRCPRDRGRDPDSVPARAGASPRDGDGPRHEVVDRAVVGVPTGLAGRRDGGAVALGEVPGAEPGAVTRGRQGVSGAVLVGDRDLLPRADREA